MKTGHMLVSTVAAVTFVASGITAVGNYSEAATCRGANDAVVEREYQSPEIPEIKRVRIDSCKAAQLIDDFGRAKDAASLASIVSAYWRPAAIPAGVLMAWAWANQEMVKSCASKGSGIAFRTDSYGGIYNCVAQ